MPKIWKTEKGLHLASLTVLEEQTWGEFEREAVWGSKEKISSTDREADSLFFDDLPSTTRFKFSGLRIHDPHVTVPCMTPVLEEQSHKPEENPVKLDNIWSSARHKQLKRDVQECWCCFIWFSFFFFFWFNVGFLFFLSCGTCPTRS